jgi:hypothetical protein
MKKLIAISFALCVMVALAGPALAGEMKTVTLEGEVLCAMCTLHEEGAKKCQNVLVVKKEGQETHYYLAKNEANTELGMVCKKAKAVQVTGQVTEEDGKLWLAATEIKPVESEG